MINKIAKLFLCLTLLSATGVLAKAKKANHEVPRRTASEEVIFHNTATVTIKAGEVERYLKAAQDAQIFELTRNEPECVSYNAFRKKEGEGNVIVFNEVWKNEAALQAHLATPHMLAFFKTINFDPSKYVITPGKGGVTFTAKPELVHGVIEVLVLEGFSATQL